MKSFLKTYLTVLGIVLGIFAFGGLLFWGLTKLFGDNGPAVAFFIIIALFLSFGITSAIENN